jgi:hypothetical protein
MSSCTCLIDSEGGVDETRPDFFYACDVRARKVHQCAECGNPIAAGEQYERATGKWDGEIQTFKTCSICVEIRLCFMCSWSYTSLWADLREYFRYEDCNPCLLDKLSPIARSKMIQLFDDILENDYDA